MVGPFMQGLFLMGIIYWYSKGMMSMINDYYRSEFQRKIQTQSAAKAAHETPLSVDNFMDYVRELEAESHPEYESFPKIPYTLEPQPNYCHKLLRFMQITGALPPIRSCRPQSNSANSAIS